MGKRKAFKKANLNGLLVDIFCRRLTMKMIVWSNIIRIVTRLAKGHCILEYLVKGDSTQCELEGYVEFPKQLF